MITWFKDPPGFSKTDAKLHAGLQQVASRSAAMGLGGTWTALIIVQVALAIVAVTASVLLLSAAGIYAMMSFTVARRWREIGIRVALGADARRVLMGIFGRASAQIGALRNE